MITLAHQAIVATVGLPGSGKSTWATQQVEADTTGLLTVVNRDHIRAMTRKPYPTDEGLVTILQQAAVEAALNAGYSVIIDDTNLNPAHLDYWSNLAFHRRVPCTFITVMHFLMVPLPEVLRRNADRPVDLRVPETDIYNMYEQWSPGWPQMAHARGHAEPESVRVGYERITP